jgi:ABC-type Fe3+/spermidine/putrescine transport system ATPase subunit
MSDRIAVMNEGRLIQVASPEEVYEDPSNLFVASFVGEMSFLAGEIVDAGSVRLKGGEVVMARTDSPPGTNVTLTLRPEKVHLYADRSEALPGRNAVDGSVARTIFQGDSMFYEVELGEAGSLDVHVENLPSMRRWDVGDAVVVDFHPEAARALAE